MLFEHLGIASRIIAIHKVLGCSGGAAVDGHGAAGAGAAVIIRVAAHDVQRLTIFDSRNVSGCQPVLQVVAVGPRVRGAGRGLACQGAVIIVAVGGGIT